MAKRKVEGYWTCSYCGTKDIGGLTKICPNCGNPQSKGLKFYLKEGQKNYLEPKIAENYGKGADWVCAYCGSYNRYNNQACKNCGAEKSEADNDYFGRRVSSSNESSSPCNKEKSSNFSYEKNYINKSLNYNNYTKKTLSDNRHSNFFRNMKVAFGIVGGITAFIAIIMLLFSIFTPKMYDVKLSNKTWYRTISIEELREVDQSNWNVPSGGRVYDKKQEIRTYNKVISHYDTEKYKVPRQEFDHYDYKYSDNGDGTFDGEKVPVYKTVYDVEYKKVPVYKNVPIYDTKYYYKIDKWCHNRTEISSGKTNEPYWPNFSLAPKQRESGRSETYTFYFETKGKKTYSKNVSYDDWKEFALGKEFHITVVSGFVTKIEP